MEYVLSTFRRIETEQRDHQSINALMRLFYDWQCPWHISEIWEDIICYHKRIESLSLSDSNGLSYAVLIKCMIKSDEMSIAQCVQCLEWMVDSKYTLSIHGSLLNELVAKCTEKDLSSLQFIHSLIRSGSIATESDDVIIQTVLLNAYGLCGAVDTALEIFESLPFSERQHNNATIAAMMKVYVQNDCHREAFAFYDLHKNDANDFLHRLALKCCIRSNEYHRGLRLCGELQQNQNIFIKTAMIDFYGHFGAAQSAQKVFDSVPDLQHDLYSINAMIGALLYNDNVDEAMAMMHRYQHRLDEYSFSFLMKWSTENERMDIGLRVIDAMPSTMTMQNVVVHRNVMEFYGVIGHLDSMLTLYSSLKNKTKNEGKASTATVRRSDIGMRMNSHSLNVVLTALNLNKRYRHCLKLYAEHQLEGDTDALSHITALKACIATEDKSTAYEIMERMMVTADGEEESVQSKNVRIECLGHFGDVDEALDLFTSITMSDRHQIDGHSLATMVAVFIENERDREALELYDRYWKLHDDVCHVLALTACGHLVDLKKGIQILRAHRLRKSQNVQILNAMISFYGHCGVIDGALDVFHGMEAEQKDTVTINAMMDAFRRCKKFRESVELFETMLMADDSLWDLDAVSIVIALKSCAGGTLFHFGRRLHEELKRWSENGNDERGWMIRDVSVEVNLIAMYGKSGAIAECEAIFEEIQSAENEKYRNEIAIWNAMLTAYGRNGELLKVKATYDLLMEIGIIPDRHTFSALITACNHSGDLCAAKMIWNIEMDDEMKQDDYVMTAMVDGMAKKGRCEEALKLLMSVNGRRGSQCRAAWMAVIGGCVRWNQLEIALKVYDEIGRRFDHGDYEQCTKESEREEKAIAGQILGEQSCRVLFGAS